MQSVGSGKAPWSSGLSALFGSKWGYKPVSLPGSSSSKASKALYDPDLTKSAPHFLAKQDGWLCSGGSSPASPPPRASLARFSFSPALPVGGIRSHGYRAMTRLSAGHEQTRLQGQQNPLRIQSGRPMPAKPSGLTAPAPQLCT